MSSMAQVNQFFADARGRRTEVPADQPQLRSVLGRCSSTPLKEWRTGRTALPVAVINVARRKREWWEEGEQRGMDEAKRKRLEELKQDFSSYELIDALYGLGTSPPDEVMGRFRAWAARMYMRKDAERPDKVNRFWLETFFQRSKVLPRKWAAARLGMTMRSFEQVVNALDLDGLVTRAEIEPLTRLVPEPWVREFHELFTQTKMRIFENHDDRCRQIHDAIRSTYGIDVEALHCVTSLALGENPPRFGYEFDAVTGDPVSTGYEVWFDLGKPMSLRPDCCSLKLYAAEREALQAVAFPGTEPLEERFGDVIHHLRAKP